MFFSSIMLGYDLAKAEQPWGFPPNPQQGTGASPTPPPHGVWDGDKESLRIGGVIGR
ncbi:MAG: hypothetical protein HY785_03240 [Oscillatoriophycideae cyanobacterium NC_groundwater_1537_Pr4_S-0.65um_50_18]|nr:hypothetical protein [Oscillatoriophycideae cyanobacterium NC_groundwater_1537_Pr4_S-0.65um_50_18]